MPQIVHLRGNDLFHTSVNLHLQRHRGFSVCYGVFFVSEIPIRRLEGMESMEEVSEGVRKYSKSLLLA